MSNSIQRRKRTRLYDEQKGRCWYCGKSVARERATLDHIVPRSRGGTDCNANLVMACRRCNRMKGNKLHFPAQRGAA